MERQIQSRQTSAVAAIGLRDITPDQVNLCMPSTTPSLDQLYAEAAGLYPFLKTKVCQWADAWGGCFQLHPDSLEKDCVTEQFVKWAIVKEDPRLRDSIKWPELKPVDRAVEKITRVFHGDPSRLQDICRQTILFDSLVNLVRCLQTMMRDRDVDIVRIKNVCKKESSVSYKHVTVKLRIIHDRSRALSLTGHVGEVHLTTKGFMAARLSTDHQSYSLFRLGRP
mmetsp:Transcript_41797/g.65283  ORF Transcript_41797/g.65283 Transcript_41797/m.65283 type:complete len:224 (+) Transcript_41797:1-672(+)